MSLKSCIAVVPKIGRYRNREDCKATFCNRCGIRPMWDKMQDKLDAWQTTASALTILLCVLCFVYEWDYAFSKKKKKPNVLIRAIRIRTGIGDTATYRFISESKEQYMGKYWYWRSKISQIPLCKGLYNTQRLMSRTVSHPKKLILQKMVSCSLLLCKSVI